MTKIITGVVVISLIVAGVWYMEHGNAEVYEAPSVVEVEKEIVINPLDEQIKQREAELSEKYEKIKQLEARRDVLEAERDRLDTEITTVTKELASFMTATTSKR
jgi:septal ring factor EnvC (AmiA/AmiB activator)